MGTIRYVLGEAWQGLRYLATRRPRRRRDRQALADYQSYRAREQTAEDRGER